MGGKGWTDEIASMLSKEHRDHQEEYPGNTHPDCPVCKFHNGTLVADKKKDED